MSRPSNISKIFVPRNTNILQAVQEILVNELRKLLTKYDTNYFSMHFLSIICLFILFFRAIFPLGIPEEFSFVSTFRKRNGRKDPWSLIRITDLSRRTQFAVIINPRKKELEMSTLNLEGRVQVARFGDVHVRKDFNFFCFVSMFF